ncbi:hypothetical protein [Streptomyces canus]|uniref:DUF7919 family protein n=1 Tax=Streptomyces canus TaxID=58343 RepID=UPI0038071FFD
MSPYEYFGDSIPDGLVALNVGWLDTEKEFARGVVTDDFLFALSSVVKNDPKMKTRGWHRCQLPHSGGANPYPATVEIDNQKISLGGAEVRVVSESGEWMIAPDLILHYVMDHSYRPPERFIDAVIAKRIAPSP